jgi:hypothetical protein
MTASLMGALPWKWQLLPVSAKAEGAAKRAAVSVAINKKFFMVIFLAER